MPARRYRSKTYKPRFVRTPGGRVAVHYKEKKVSSAKCANCGRPLGGVPRLKSSELRTIPKTSKRPNRPFGGYLCHECCRQLIKNSVRE